MNDFTLLKAVFCILLEFVIACLGVALLGNAIDKALFGSLRRKKDGSVVFGLFLGLLCLGLLLLVVHLNQ